MKRFEGDPSICTLFKNGAKVQILKANNSLLVIEREGVSQEHLKTIKSNIHTLKGDSRMIGLESMSVAAHRIEDLLEALQKKEGNARSGIIKKLFALLDEIGAAVDKLPEDVVEIDLALYEIEEEAQTAESAQKEPKKKTATEEPEEKKTKPKQTTGKETNVESKEETEIINLDVQKIEDLISKSAVFPQYFNKFNHILGLLTKTRAELESRYRNDVSVKDLGSIVYQMSHELSFYDLASRQFQNEITKLKLVPLSVIFDLFPRLVRDVAEKTKKTIRFTVTGRDVELDKTIVEKLKTILIHILNNAVDHGCEPGDVREKQGKPAEGRVVLNAFNRGDNVILEIGDDGAGLDIERIREKAVEKGFVEKERAPKLRNEEIIPFIFESGFSTKQVSQISGRGIGMDVVATTVKELNGEITVKTEAGKGTSFIISLPLISSFIPVTVFVIGDNLFGIPSSYIKSVIRIKTSVIREIGNNTTVISVDNIDISLVDLGAFLGFGEDKNDQNKNIIITRSQDELTGLVVNDIVFEKKMLIRKPDWNTDKFRVIIGAVLSGRERAIPIINVIELFKLLKMGNVGMTRVKNREIGNKDFRLKNVLLVEDSVVTRTRIKEILAMRNLNIFEASNGVEALDHLAKQKIDIVITDIEMPVMNGLELIKNIKLKSEFKTLPIIVVSSYKNYERNLTELGIDKFIDKSEFKAELLMEKLMEAKII